MPIKSKIVPVQVRGRARYIWMARGSSLFGIGLKLPLSYCHSLIGAIRPIILEPYPNLRGPRFCPIVLSAKKGA